jgi:serine/threonine protein kinase
VGVRPPARSLAGGGRDEGFAGLRDYLLGRPRDDLPRTAGLDALLRETLDGKAGARSTVRLSELIDRLVRYRNNEIGHGAAGQRPEAFHDRAAQALALAAAELLGRMSVLAGRRLVHVASVRKVAGGWLVDRYELHGEAPRRLERLELPGAEEGHLPEPDRVHVEGPAPNRRVSLHPLVSCELDGGEVHFLNARRGRGQTEYLCYTSGKSVNRPDTGAEQRALLVRVLGIQVSEAQQAAWAERFRAEESEPADEGQPEGAQAARRVGEFELQSELGRGGMGVVYRAWQPSLNRPVALKRLLRSGDARTEARFAREVRALGRVDHPNLVRVLTSGSDGEHWFYAMELVDGAPLSAVCDALSGSGGRSTWEQAVSTACLQARRAEKSLVETRSDGAASATTQGEPAPAQAPAGIAPSGPTGVGEVQPEHVRRVVELVRQTAGAVHALHEAGVVHRDIKPGNVMVTPDGTRAVLLDLGLAQLADEADGKLTRTRQFVGTLRYASPEQVFSAHAVDRRSDVYALGATLWELLALRPLFGAGDDTPTPELMRRIQFEEPGRPGAGGRAVPRDLESIVLQCLEKPPDRRYKTARELADDLGRWLVGEPVHARQATWVHRLGTSLRRHRKWVAIAVVLLLLQAVIVTAVTRTRQPEGGEGKPTPVVAPAGTSDKVQLDVRVRQKNRYQDLGRKVPLSLVPAGASPRLPGAGWSWSVQAARSRACSSAVMTRLRLSGVGLRTRRAGLQSGMSSASKAAQQYSLETEARTLRTVPGA